jgi:rhomboid family GlyGly-CTERM serine protease
MRPAHRIPRLSLALSIAAIATHVLPGLPPHLEFQRAALAQGEAWRWLSAHLTHFDGNHLAWDVGVLLALGAMIERDSPQRFAAALALAAVTITPAVWFFQPHFTAYRGLSGLDSAAFGLLAGTLMQRPHRDARWCGWIALVAFAAKSLVELMTARTVFAAGAGYAPVPLAHLLGLFAGLTVAFRRARRPATLPGKPIGRLVDKPGLLEGCRNQPPARIAGVDVAQSPGDADGHRAARITQVVDMRVEQAQITQ